MKKLLPLLCFIQIACFIQLYAQTPGTINVQGVLTNASGQNVANGNYSITFRLYATANDATILWEEKQDNLNVQNGIFNAGLGKIKPFNLPFDKTYYLGLQIGQEAELSPRIEMNSVPFSMMAKNVENNAISTAKIQNNAVTADKIAPPLISSLNGVINDGGDIKIKSGKNIEITPDQNDKSVLISVTGLDTVANDIRYVNENQPNVIGQPMIKDNAVSVEKIIPNVVSSINGVNNDGGNINIVAGANITILNNDQENTITISAVNPGTTNPGISKVNAGKGIAVAGSDGPTAVVSISPNSLTDTEVADKSLTAISLANGAVGTTEIQANAVTADKIAPNVLSSINGISNDGGNVNLVAGNNVTIVPNDANKTITISASGAGGGTSNFTQLLEGSNISIQNALGPISTIGLKPQIKLGPTGSLQLLNGNSLNILNLEVNNNGGGFFGLRNEEGTELFRMSTGENRQGRFRVSNRLGNPVADLLANDFSDGEMTFYSVLTTPTLRLGANDDAGGLINVFNRQGTIVSRLTTNTIGDGRLMINSVDNVNILDLKANLSGGGYLGLFNQVGTESVRLTTTENRGGQINVYNRSGNLAVFSNTNNAGDGGLFINSGDDVPIIDIQANDNGGGLIRTANEENTEMFRITSLNDQQPSLKMFNRLGNQVGELSATQFSDGDLTLRSVLTNPTVQLTANDDVGGLVNVFNPNGSLAVFMRGTGSGFMSVLNSDETEMIQLGIKSDQNARITVNNRLGSPVVDIESNDFSDGSMTLRSVLKNPTVLIKANDNAGGHISIFNKTGGESARMTEFQGLGAVSVANTTGILLASMYGTSGNGYGAFEVYHGANNKLMAKMTRDANENGLLQILNKNQFPIASLSGSESFDGKVGIFNADGLKMAELFRDPVSLGGKLSVFNKDARTAGNLLAGANGSGLLQLYNNLNNLSAGFLADDAGGRLFIHNGTATQSPRVDLSNTANGGQMLLYSKESNLIHQLFVRPNGEGTLEIRGKNNYPNPVVLLGGNDNSEGILNLFNNQNKPIVVLGPSPGNAGELDLRNKAGNLSGQFVANETGATLAITDGVAAANFRAILDNQTSGGRLALFNKETKFVSILQTDANGEGNWRIVNKSDATKNRLELGGDAAGAGYLKIFNNAFNRTGEMVTGATGGELNIYNSNGINTSKMSNSAAGAGMMEVASATGVKVGRLTTLDGTGYIGLDNVDKLEVVRITANQGKGGGMGIKNQTGADIINLTQDNAYGAILVNNATGGQMATITHNTINGGFIGTKDHKGGDAIWLTTNTKGGGNITAFNDLGKAAATIFTNDLTQGNVSVFGSTGNELARMTGTSNGTGLVNIFNSTGVNLAGLSNNPTTGSGFVFANNSAGALIGGLTTNNTTGGGYLFVNHSGKDVARMTTTAAGGGIVVINNPSSNVAAYLTLNSANGGYVGIANTAGNDRARITTNTGGSGLVSLSNSAGADVVEATVSANNHGTVATYNSTGGFMAGLLATTTGHGYIRASNTAGAERAFMASQDFGGEIAVRDLNGNKRVTMRGAGNMEVTEADGSYANLGSTGSGVRFFFVDNLQHPRLEMGPGFVSSKGPNGGESSFLSNLVGSQNLGFVGVRNSSVFEGPTEAGMYVNTSGQGVLFADVKNFKVDYPGKPDKQIWYGSLEGPELAAYIRGTGKISNGKATIEFTDHYQKIANTGTMTVILTPLSGKSKGLAVVKKSSTGFEVEELLEGSGNYEFDWEVKCVRKGHEGFEVVRNKSDDPTPFRSATLPVNLPDRKNNDIQVDQVTSEKVVKQ